MTSSCLRHDYRIVEFPLTITDRKNGPGNTLSFTITKNFGPTLVNEFIYGAGRGSVTIAPSDDRASRSVTGINTPLLYPDANTTNLIPSLNLGPSPTPAALANTSVFGPFVQKFVINNFIDNLTKVKGNHTFKFGVYYQRASNASNSQNHVQSDIDFTNNTNNPLNTGYAFVPTPCWEFTTRTPRRASSWRRVSSHRSHFMCRTIGRLVADSALIWACGFRTTTLMSTG